MPDTISHKLTASHWGVGVARIAGGVVQEVAAEPGDPAPSRINDNIASSLHGRARVLRPAIRQGWLRGVASPADGARGREPFVEVPWDEALDMVADELSRVKAAHGNEAIYAGSYGWASAGRFHHAQSQLKRFLNCIGGFTRSEGNYSYNAALGLMPHIVGPYRDSIKAATRWSVIAEHSDLVVMFGGLAERNMHVSDGGAARHRMPEALQACADAGVRFVNLSPLRTDAAEVLGAEWLSPKPGTDVAVMLGLANTLLVEDLADREFLARYCTGFERIEPYIRAHDANWASGVSGVPVERLRALAREMAAGRTMVSCAAGVQRAEYGEQPLWMCVTLASMLGQIGLPGGGYTIGYAVNANIGNMERLFQAGSLPQSDNPVRDYLPVAMVSDMLLNPGAVYNHQGETRRFPDTKLVWWAGGNPFHHHQDLNRLRDAFQRPETVIVNEMNWTATARHADIVLPIAAPQERMDFAAGRSDNALVPMPALIPPTGSARVEYDMFCDLATRLGKGEAFGEGRDTDGWLRHIWAQTQERGAQAGVSLPDWDVFIAGGVVEVPDPSPRQVFLAEFRADPEVHPLPTPSGRIELYSETIAAMDLPDCKGHATWFAPRDTDLPLALISGQPATRLHSQHDNGDYSMSAKVQGREPVLIHPNDAQVRGIKDGDVVEISNVQGRCLAGARITDDIAHGCLFLWTGAWYDPDDAAPQARCRHGNPNTLTRDLRSSALTQSPAAHGVQVEIARFEGLVPPVTVHDVPTFVPR